MRVDSYLAELFFRLFDSVNNSSWVQRAIERHNSLRQKLNVVMHPGNSGTLETEIGPCSSRLDWAMQQENGAVYNL